MIKFSYVCLSCICGAAQLVGTAFAKGAANMNIGLYQSAASLSSLERWQDSVTQNITSANSTGYKKRTVSFSGREAGEIQTDSKKKLEKGQGAITLFPQVTSGISFSAGESQATRRELDASIQGEGFFEIRRQDGTKAFTRNGEFRVRPDRTLVTSTGDEVLTEAGGPIVLQAGGGSVSFNQDGTVFQGDTALGKFSIVKFADNSRLVPVAGGFFTTPDDMPAVREEKPDVLQGYLESGNVSPLREMVDLVLISRAYEANQKVITTVDQQFQKTLEALG